MRNVQRASGRSAMAILGVVLATYSVEAATLDDVKARGMLRCGVSTGVPGFGAQDDSGRWSGFDVDFCRAIAAAVLGDATKVSFIPTSASSRFDVLKSGGIDLLSRNTTWTMSRDTGIGLSFAAVTFFDGQALMVRNAMGVRRLADLTGSTICVQSGTTTELNLADYFSVHRIPHSVVTFLTVEDAMRAYDSGRCDVFTTDRSGLIAQRSKLPRSTDHMILPEIISKEPLGPVVRQNDMAWFNIVRWTHFAMLTAEELGVTSQNLDVKLDSSDPAVKRLVGRDGEFGVGLGLTRDWVVRIVRSVGNYGEAFERNVGVRSALGIIRDRNALWSDGGLQYAPPIR